MAFTFHKARTLPSIEVREDGETIGYVERKEDWVVRGTRIRWEARRRLRPTRSFPTRREAAEYLSSKNP